MTSEASIARFVKGSTSVLLECARTGRVLETFDAPHTIVDGASNDDLVACVGCDPPSLHILRLEGEARRVTLKLEHSPTAIAVRRDAPIIAIALNEGL
jgi:hypothetical protein